MIIAFMCKTKSFAIVFLFFILFTVPGWTGKSLFANISLIVTQEACDQDQACFIGRSKKSLCNYCFSKVLIAMRVTHVMLYLIHGNQHSQHPKKLRKPETWKQDRR